MRSQLKQLKRIQMPKKYAELAKWVENHIYFNTVEFRSESNEYKNVSFAAKPKRERNGKRCFT